MCPLNKLNSNYNINMWAYNMSRDDTFWMVTFPLYWLLVNGYTLNQSSCAGIQELLSVN